MRSSARPPQSTHGPAPGAAVTTVAGGASSPRRVLLLPGTDLSWAILRQALAALAPDYMVDEVADAEAARAVVCARPPDAIVAGMVFGLQSALPLLAELHRACPTSTLVVLAAHFTPAEVDALAALDVAGYLQWDGLDTGTFHHCLAAVLSGRARVSTGPLVAVAVPPSPAQPAALDDRERAVLAHLATGATREQVASALGLSLRTTVRVLARLATRLAAPSVFVLGMRAAQLGVVPVEPLPRSDGRPDHATAWPEPATSHTALGARLRVHTSVMIKGTEGSPVAKGALSWRPPQAPAPPSCPS
jgi:DNA-binding NarL/FixJ family response regulator